jgi:hypothetical protein
MKQKQKIQMKEPFSIYLLGQSQQMYMATHVESQHSTPSHVGEEVTMAEKDKESLYQSSQLGPMIKDDGNSLRFHMFLKDFAFHATSNISIRLGCCSSKATMFEVS